MTNQLPTHSVIIKQAYPRDPGLLARNIGPDRIGIFRVSDSGRTYGIIGEFDHLMNQLSGPPELSSMVMAIYHAMITLKPPRE
jgi:hypothetical protein